MIKGKKIQQFFEAPCTNNWYGKFIIFENIDFVCVTSEKVTVYTKSGRDFNFEKKYYDEFKNAYINWLNNDR